MERTATGANDGHVARFDGTLGRTCAADRARGGIASGVAVTLDGGAVLVGDFAGGLRLGGGQPGEVALQSDFRDDVFGARFDGAGALLCSAQVAGPQYDQGETRSAGTFSHTAVAAPGTTWSTPITCGGGDDAFLTTWWF